MIVLCSHWSCLNRETNLMWSWKHRETCADTIITRVHACPIVCRRRPSCQWSEAKTMCKLCKSPQVERKIKPGNDIDCGCHLEWECKTKHNNVITQEILHLHINWVKSQFTLLFCYNYKVLSEKGTLSTFQDATPGFCNWKAALSTVLKCRQKIVP